MRSLGVVLGSLVFASATQAAVVSAVFGGRVPCVERDGVQFCEGGFGHRVESFDGVPLDANVTLPPASMDGPFPLIIELHGWSLGKTAGPLVAWAQDGYAALSASARGFHGSCGSAASRTTDPTLTDPDACTTRGWTHLADTRYEGRDSQLLAGLLVDDGLVIPDRIGATGASYGGGRTMILAALRNRVMLPDGTLMPWRSPGGRDLAIAAGIALVPWTDLAEALSPAGRTLDYRTDNPYGRRAGTQKQSWNQVLFAAGQATGYYAPPGVDPDADLNAWTARLAEGEPYDGDPMLQHVLDEITQHHSAYYIDDSVAPAPLFIYNAWTDDLFPVDEAVRFWRRAKAHHPAAEIALHFADGFGHPRASLGGNLQRVSDVTQQFFARHLKGTGAPLPAVETYTQACGDAVVAGPFTASDWDALHPGEVRFAERRSRVVRSAGGDPATATAVNPIGAGPCITVSADDDPGAVTYRLPAAGGAGYTLMGAPTVIADLAVSGSFAALAARLWDVAPAGTQTLVSQAFYRPRSDNLGPQVFQLHPNGWHVAAGHVAKLELLGQSAPFGRASTGTFEIAVGNLELRLPVADPPDGRTVKTPAAPVLPPDAVEPPDAGVPACTAAPDDACRTPIVAGKGLLLVKQGARGALAWKWRKGALTPKADFGAPRATTAYRLCVYDGGAALLWSATAPAGGRCGGRKAKPCWSESRAGFAYVNRQPASDGVDALVLRQGTTAGKASIQLRTSRSGPMLPVGQTVTVQLRNSVGVCWSAAYRVPAQTNGSRLQLRDTTN